MGLGRKARFRRPIWLQISSDVMHSRTYKHFRHQTIIKYILDMDAGLTSDWTIRVERSIHYSTLIQRREASIQIHNFYPPKVVCLFMPKKLTLVQLQKSPPPRCLASFQHSVVRHNHHHKQPPFLHRAAYSLLLTGEEAAAPPCCLQPSRSVTSLSSLKKKPEPTESTHISQIQEQDGVGVAGHLDHRQLPRLEIHHRRWFP